MFHDTVFNNIQYGDITKPSEAVFEAAKMAELHDTIVNRFPMKYDTQVGERGLKLSGMVAVGKKLQIIVKIILAMSGLSVHEWWRKFKRNK